MGRCWCRGVLALVIGISLLATGCPKKTKGPDLSAEEAAARAGVDEEALGGPRGSLAEAQQGIPLDRSSGPLEDIHFAFDSFELDEQARQILRRNGEWLSERARVRVELEGHCDDRGTVEYNLALGAKRAASAKSYLVSLGVQPDRITTISYGEELPLCHEPAEDCWQRNRRAHFVIVGE